MKANYPLDETDLVGQCVQHIKQLEGQLSAATPKRGLATLAAGAVTVALPAVKAGSQIMLTTQSPGGTVGTPFVFSKTAGVGFIVHSTSGTDTSTVGYLIF